MHRRWKGEEMVGQRIDDLALHRRLGMQRIGEHRSRIDREVLAVRARRADTRRVAIDHCQLARQARDPAGGDARARGPIGDRVELARQPDRLAQLAERRGHLEQRVVQIMAGRGFDERICHWIELWRTRWRLAERRLRRAILGNIADLRALRGLTCSGSAPMELP